MHIMPDHLTEPRRGPCMALVADLPANVTPASRCRAPCSARALPVARSVPLAEPQEEIALSSVDVSRVLTADGAELDAASVANTTPCPPEVLSWVATQLLGGAQICANLVEAIHMLTQHRDAELTRHLPSVQRGHKSSQ